MTITVEAVYENGVLRPEKPLPLAERERVHISIESGTNPVRESAGRFHSSDPSLIRQIASDPGLEYGDQEHA